MTQLHPVATTTRADDCHPEHVALIPSWAIMV